MLDFFFKKGKCQFCPRNQAIMSPKRNHGIDYYEYTIVLGAIMVLITDSTSVFDFKLIHINSASTM